MIPSMTPFVATLGPLGLLVVMGIVFAETGLLAGFFLPGDSLLFTVGILTASGVLGLRCGWSGSGSSSQRWPATRSAT
jgi:membrane-associated protein